MSAPDGGGSAEALQGCAPLSPCSSASREESCGWHGSAGEDDGFAHWELLRTIENYRNWDWDCQFNGFHVMYLWIPQKQSEHGVTFSTFTGRRRLIASTKSATQGLDLTETNVGSTAHVRFCWLDRLGSHDINICLTNVGHCSIEFQLSIPYEILL